MELKPKEDNDNQISNIDFFGLLTILFICLKLTGYIDWSWWYVLFPILPKAICIVLLIAIYITKALLMAINKK